jgi:hypothetical protein
VGGDCNNKTTYMEDLHRIIKIFILNDLLESELTEYRGSKFKNLDISLTELKQKSIKVTKQMDRILNKDSDAFSDDVLENIGSLLNDSIYTLLKELQIQE